MPRSAANADAARTTCSGARSRARKVLSPSSQPRPRRLPAGRRHLVAGVVIATVVPPGTCRPPRDPAADGGTAKEQAPSTSERNGLRAPVPAVVRCSSPLEAVRLPSRPGAQSAREHANPACSATGGAKLLLLSVRGGARIVGYYFVDVVFSMIPFVFRGSCGSYVPMSMTQEDRHTRPAASHPA